MALKGLREFVRFASEEFLEGKTLEVTSITPWQDFNTKVELGTKVEVAIVEDKTKYTPKPDGSVVNNKYEKLTVKVTQKPLVNVGELVRIDGITKSSVFGDYQNQLSIEAKQILPAQTFKKD